MGNKLTKDKFTGVRHNIVLVITCTRVHGKEVKFKRAIGLGGLYTILMKQRRFEHQETIKHRGMKYAGELMEDKGYFSKVCL